MDYKDTGKIIKALRDIRDVDSQMVMCEGELTGKLIETIENNLSKAEEVLNAYKDSHSDYWAIIDLHKAKEKVADEYEKLKILNQH